MSTTTWPSWGIGVAGLALAGVSLAASRGIGAARLRWRALVARVDDLAGRLQAAETRADLASASSSRRAGRDPATPIGHGPRAKARDRDVAATPGSRSPGASPPRNLTTARPSAPPLILVPSLEATGSPEAADEAVAGLGRRFGAIWAMADAGELPPAIARATGHPVGQVELILGLRRPAPVGEHAPDA